MQQDSGKRKTARAAPRAASQAVPGVPGEQDGPGGQGGQLADACAAISSMAYSLYEARGCIDGRALEDWLEAEAHVSQGGGATKAEAARATVAG